MGGSRKQFFEIKWIIVTILFLINRSKSESETWSKPEQNAKQENDWIPVQGKCLTCTANRDLESQSTNEQISKILSPPVPQFSHLGPPPLRSLQYVMNKQPRIMPLAPFPQFNTPYSNQLQSNKLLPPEGPKQFYKFEGSHFPNLKQPFNLPSQQIIPQTSSQQQSIPQQRFQVSEPYPFTLPLKTAESTTSKTVFQSKVRFPDSEPPKVIPNKLNIKNNEEIQLLYVPVDPLQRGKKNMKELLNQNQFQHSIPHGFIQPQYNFQYTPSLPKQPENPFYFPPNFSPAPNFIQLNPVSSPKLSENVFANISKNILQPYFTINGLYSSLPQIQPMPTKQSELQYYLQPALLGTSQVKNIEPFKVNSHPTIDQNKHFNKYTYNSNSHNIQNDFLSQNNPVTYSDLKNIQSTVTNLVDLYSSATTSEAPRITQYITEKSTLQQDPSKYSDSNYHYLTTKSQPLFQNQQYLTEQHNSQPLRSQYNTIAQDNFLQKQIYQNQPISSSVNSPQTQQPTFEEQTLSNYPIPHQPPLSFYMEKLHNSKINDVLYLLKDAKTIPVLDSIENEPPQVFVGPSELQPPKGYIKFELPYLSSLDYNRIEKMIDKLPFFVAPLNFKPPPGYSKIPFPAPHIGSVVLSNSTVTQESINDNRFEQNYRPTEQIFPSSSDLSTITPQLTSQINSLLETPSSVSIRQESFQNYEYSTKKSPYKTTPRPIATLTSAEFPKRNLNRQRKPIYRGYLTSTETSASHETVSAEDQKSNFNERIKFDSNREADNYGDFSTKPKFNLNNGIDNDLHQNPLKSDFNFQPQQVLSTYQPIQNNVYELTNFFTNPNSSQNIYTKSPTKSQQTEQEYSFLTSKQSQNDDFYVNNQNYPFYNFNTVSSSQLPVTEPQPTISPLQTSTIYQSSNYNFNNVKPLSQYNPYIQNEESVANVTEIINPPQNEKSNSNQFWNQNQFYKVNPSTMEYLSSIDSYQSTSPETSFTSTERNIYQNRFTKSSTIPTFENTFTSTENIFPSSSFEPTEKISLSTYHPRGKQRPNTNRYQQKFTTEKQINDENKENFDHPQKILSDRSNRPVFQINQDITTETRNDSIFQSTENNESSTKTEIKQRRRRPLRPTQASITPAIELSSISNRNYRTRASRYPTTSTEKYRIRRPTTNVASSSENLNSHWSSFNFAPSVPAFNDITNTVDKTKTHADNEVDTKNKNVRDFDNYWNEAVSIHQSQSYEVNPSTRGTFSSLNVTEEHNTEVLPWYNVSSKHNTTEEFSRPTSTAEPYIQQYSFDNSNVDLTKNKTENNDLNDNIPIKGVLQTKFDEEINITVPSLNSKNSSNDELIYLSEDKIYNQETKKDTQKKAYDPQDEKKISGRRRGTWVRRIRVKRPQDVFETAESQNLGRITDNLLPTSDSKQSKTEKEDLSDSKASNYKEKKESNNEVKLFSVTEEKIPSTEYILEQPEHTNVTTEKDDYANLQNNFAQMLSDFLNSNEKSVSLANNIDKYNNISTENSISFILGLENNENKENKNSSFSNNNYEIINSAEIIVTSTDEVPTATNYLNNFNAESSESQTTIEPQEISTSNKFIGTSTTTEISLETEICYRGKCVKTKKSKASDLLPVE